MGKGNGGLTGRGSSVTPCCCDKEWAGKGTLNLHRPRRESGEPGQEKKSDESDL